MVGLDKLNEKKEKKKKPQFLMLQFKRENVIH